jgi:hypothetical protein
VEAGYSCSDLVLLEPALVTRRYFLAWGNNFKARLGNELTTGQTALSPKMPDKLMPPSFACILVVSAVVWLIYS